MHQKGFQRNPSFCSYKSYQTFLHHLPKPVISNFQVWLAEWTESQVAVKELIGFSGSADDARAWQEMQNEVGGALLMYMVRAVGGALFVDMEGGVWGA